VISLTALLYLDVAGAGVLAAWTVARLPRLRPKTITTSLGCVAASMLVAQVAPPFIPHLMALTDGMYVVLLGCVLPIFFLLFLTSGWLLLAILERRGGTGGGHRVSLPQLRDSRS
jgi:hypothetical protein